DLLGHDAELLQRFAGPAADAELEAFEVVDGLDLFAKPAAHLRAGIAANERVYIVFLPELIHQLRAVAVVEPGILLAAVEAERDSAEQRPGRVLADIVIHGRMADLDGAVLNRVENLQSRHDFARGEGLNLKLVVGGLGHMLGEGFASAVKSV